MEEEEEAAVGAPCQSEQLEAVVCPKDELKEGIVLLSTYHGSRGRTNIWYKAMY
jgi:hypothetical protein